MFSKKESLPYSELNGLFSDKSLFHDYIHDFDKVKEFYGRDYRNHQNILDFTDKLDFSDEKRKAIHTILKDYHKDLDLSQNGKDNIEALLDNNSFTVITGQQCGLFTGPLFTIYKALTAIVLAEELTALSDKKFIPIFWIASEDHDFHEVNHIIFADDNGLFNQLSIDIESDSHSVSDISLENKSSEIIEQLKELWQNTEFSPAIFELLNKNSDNLAQSFLHLLNDLFKEYGLLFIEPNQLRELSVDFNIQALEKDEAIHNEVKTASTELSKLNLPTALDMGEGLNLFYYHDNKRIRLQKDKDNLSCKSGIVNKTKDELLTEAKNHPERFSQNVVLRPVNQDRIFPNAATICGPGEIAYFAQLKGVYKLFNQEMPVIYPRASLTLYQKKFQKIQSRFDLTIKDILNQDYEDKINSTYEDLEDHQFISDFESKLIEEIGLLREKAQTKGKGIVESLNPSVKKIEHEIHKVKERYIKKVEETLGISKKQIERVKSMMTPKNKPQERIFNYFFYENYYGRELLQEIKKQMDIKDFKHQVLYYE